MRRIVILAVLAIAACAVTASDCFAAGWSFTADTPLSYTFDHSSAIKLPSPNGANPTWKSRETTSVSGSKILLIAPFHLGIGYEDYTVNQQANVTSPFTGSGNIHMNIQMTDVVLDLPMRFLNVTLGVGQGQANSDFTLPPAPPGPSKSRHADAQQVFVVLGIPFGQRIDLHVGYHWVSIQDKTLSFQGQAGPYDKLQLSGEMLSAGLRLNF